MPSVSLEHLLSVCGGTGSDKGTDLLFSRFVFDSRMADSPGSLFFALMGSERDGHSYVPQLAGRQGVAALVRHDYQAPTDLNLPLVRVENPLISAQILAVDVRSRLEKTRFVGVTGSAGKTSAKEFIFQILSHKNTAYRSPGNWNNWLGLPFALLNMTGQESHGVFELGMSSPGIGEIALLSEILRPHIAVILNALPVHLEFLKSVEQVAKAKCEILNGLTEDGVALFNIDSAELSACLLPLRGKRLIPFSPTREQGELYYKSRRVVSDGVELSCSCFGVQHHFFTTLTHPAQHANMLAAIGTTLLLGLNAGEIAEAVSTLKAVEGRGIVKRFAGLTVLDETYNSNPEAARYALDWLASFPGARTAVLGDMLELGEHSDVFHRQLGIYSATKGLKRLVAVGEKARLIAEGALQAGMPEESVRHVETALECRTVLREILTEGDVVLFKASRGLALERAIPS